MARLLYNWPCLLKKVFLPARRPQPAQSLGRLAFKRRVARRRRRSRCQRFPSVKKEAPSVEVT